MLVAVFCACVVLFRFVQWFLKRRHMLRLAAKVPTIPGVLPILGHAHRVFGKDGCGLFEIVKEISEDANRNGGITTAWFLMKPHFVITDPKDAGIALNACLQKNYLYNFFQPWLGEGLFTAKMPTWLSHRRMLSTAFSPQVLQSFQPIFDQQARKLTAALGQHADGQPFDVASAGSLAIISWRLFMTALGIPNGETKIDAKFHEACHKMLFIITRRIQNCLLHFNFVFNCTALKREQDQAIKVLHKSSDDIIAKRKQQFDTVDHKNPNETKFKPFLQLILELAATKGAFNDREIREEVDTMLVAGHDTSALVMQYVTIMLGSYPSVQDKVYAELKEIFGDSDRDVSKEDLSKMVYTEAVINETIRLYPIGSLVAREVDKDLQLSQYTLPAGSTVFVSFWSIHRGPEWGPDADRFRPERWLDPDSLPDLHTTYGGFSIGKRMCIGKAYSMMSMKTTVAHILRRYRISADHSQLRLKLDVMLRPEAGHHISMEPR